MTTLSLEEQLNACAQQMREFRAMESLGGLLDSLCNAAAQGATLGPEHLAPLMEMRMFARDAWPSSCWPKAA